MSAEQNVVMVSGRVVWVNGDLFTGALDTVYGTANQPKINAKTGKQDTVYRFGVAVTKADLNDPQKGAIWQAIQKQAHLMYPSGAIPPIFAWKYKDGDSQGVNDKGQVVDYSKKEGYPGCLVFTLSTNIQPRFFRWEGGQNVQVADGIKCGDYVNVQVKVDGQVSGKPGLYLNPMAVQLVAAGKEIINAPTGDQMFGTAAPQTPAGYVPPPAPAAMPMPAPVAPAAPGPHYGVLPPTHQPAGEYPQNPPMPSGPAPAAAYPSPAGYPPSPAPAFGVPGSPTPHAGMPAPIGYPPVAAPTTAYPGNNGMPPLPGVPR